VGDRLTHRIIRLTGSSVSDSPTIAPDEPEALRAAIAYHQQGQLDMADGLYQQVLQDTPDHVQALRLRAVLARHRADYALSIELLEHLCQLEPGDVLPVNELALSYMAAGELYLAEQSLRAALKIEPQSLQALANLGALLQRRGFLEAAAEQYSAFLDIEPEDIEVRCNLANALMEAGQDDLALTAIGEALKRSPGHPLILANKGAILCAQEAYLEAVEVLEPVCQKGPVDDMALVNLGYAMRHSGDIHQSAEVLRAAVRVNPANARAVADLANTEMQLGQQAQALSRCADFLAKYPGERLVTAAYILALNDAGQCDKAKAIQGLDELVTVIDISAPAGYEDLASFNRELVRLVTEHSSLITDPVRKSTMGGAQTGELDGEGSPVMAAFISVVTQAVNETVKVWEQAGLTHHPVMAYQAKRWMPRVWGTILSAGGKQQPHLHPLGWISGVYYAGLPEEMAGKNQDDGALELGTPPAHFYSKTEPDRRIVVPAEGRLVLFPSYCYHQTLPFKSKQQRISVAFDIVPLSR